MLISPKLNGGMKALPEIPCLSIVVRTVPLPRLDCAGGRIWQIQHSVAAAWSPRRSSRSGGSPPGPDRCLHENIHRKESTRSNWDHCETLVSCDSPGDCLVRRAKRSRSDAATVPRPLQKASACCQNEKGTRL